MEIKKKKKLDYLGFLFSQYIVSKIFIKPIFLGEEIFIKGYTYSEFYKKWRD